MVCEDMVVRMTGLIAIGEFSGLTYRRALSVGASSTSISSEWYARIFWQLFALSDCLKIISPRVHPKSRPTSSMSACAAREARSQFDRMARNPSFVSE